MREPDLFLLIEKYFNNSITQDEIIILENLLKRSENIEIFKDLVKDNYQLTTKNLDFNPEDLFAKIETKLEKVNSTKTFNFKTNYKYALAASVFLIVALTIFISKENRFSNFNEPIIVNNQIKKVTSKAVLTLADGSDVLLEKGQIYETNNVTGNGEALIYSKQEVKKINFNTITIPRGAHFFIELSDGTKVWLNSETQLRYPETFLKGTTREVELVYGEAFFEVTSSAINEGSSFKVFNKSQEVEVLGTQFNIQAYKGKTMVYTTLVEGKVAVGAVGDNKLLIPGEQSKVNIEDGKIEVTIVDVFNEISWKEGILNFEGKTLKDLMEMLARWYDIKVVFENKELEKIKFLGKLNRNQTIEEVLFTIKGASAINNFEINNKTVILK